MLLDDTSSDWWLHEPEEVILYVPRSHFLTAETRASECTLYSVINTVRSGHNEQEASPPLEFVLKTFT
jgi:hypothetical protein